MPADNEFIPTRRSLLHRLKDWSDEEGWRQFFETYWRLLYSVARRAGLSEAEAEDVVQETIVAVAKKMPDFKYDPALGSFKSWLLVVTRRRIIDYQRKKARHPENNRVGAGSDSGETDRIERIADPDAGRIERIYEEEWEQHLFQAALERVKAVVSYEQFQMFDCYAIKGWPVEKVAQTLSTTVSAVYNAKHRIARAIKEEVERLERQMT